MAEEAKQHVIEKLSCSLDRLCKNIESYRKARLLGPLVEDFTSRLLGLNNQGGMDVVSEALDGMTKDIEEEIDRLLSVPPSRFWYPAILPQFIGTRFEPSKHCAGSLDEAQTLLQETVKRRSPRADLYRLAFYSQLPKKTYGLHCHFKGMPFPPKRVADVIHERHKKLEELVKVAIMIYETVVIIDTTAKRKVYTETMERALDVLKYALQLNENFPEMDGRLSEATEFGESALRIFDSQVVAYCSDRLTGRTYEEIDYQFLLDVTNRWWSAIDGLHAEHKLEMYENDGRRFYDETQAEHEEMRRLRLRTMKEIQSWNLPDGNATPTDFLLSIDGHSLAPDSLSDKIKSVLNIPVISSRMDLPEMSTDVRGGFAFVKQLDVSSSSELKSIFPSCSNVALKILIHDESLSAETQYLRFIRELRAWSRMTHQNIVPLLGIWTECLPWSITPAFISPWMSQGTLASFIRSNPHIPLSKRFKHLHDIASALEYMHYHEFRISHGDVRADNVLMDNNTAYLSDFGLATIYEGVEGFEKGLRGNWRWLPPEMFETEDDDGKYPNPTVEGDMFAFGCLILEVLSGGLPYLGVEDHRGIARRSEDSTFLPNRPPSIPDGSHWFFCLNCWKESPALRPTAREAKSEMEKFLEKASKSENGKAAQIF